MKILVSLSGGLVNAVYLDEEAAAAKVQVVIADYDVEGTQCETVLDPDGDKVLLWTETPITESPHAEKMFALEEHGHF